MSNLPERVKKLSKPASSVQHFGKTAYTVPGEAQKGLKKVLEPKLRQNKKERNASEEEARHFMVK